MSFGMIGALAGAGQGLIEQGKYQAKQDEADAQMGREKGLQDYLMAKREQYQIASEGRQETRTVDSENRAEERTVRTEGRTDARHETQADMDYARLQREAEGRRAIKAGDKSADLDAELTTKAAHADDIQTAARAEAVGKETPGDKDVKAAHAKYYGSLGDAQLEKADKLGNGSTRMSAADATELKEVQENIKQTGDLIKKGRADGSWNDDQLTPGQKRLQSDLVVQQKRQQAILSRNREPAPTPGATNTGMPGEPTVPTTRDPLGIRPPSPSTARSTMIGAHPHVDLKPGVDNGNDNSPAGILGNQLRKLQAQLPTTTEPEAKARLQQDINSLVRDAKTQGITLNPTAPAPAAPLQPAPAAPAAVTPIPNAPVAPAVASPVADVAPQSQPGPTPGGAPVQGPAGGPAQTGTSPKEALASITGGDQQPGADPLLKTIRDETSGGIPSYESRVQALRQKATPGDGGFPRMGMQTVAGAPAEPAMVSIPPAVRQAAEALKAAQAQTVQAATSQNPNATRQAINAAADASARLNQALQGIPPAQAAKMKSQLGIQ